MTYPIVDQRKEIISAGNMAFGNRNHQPQITPLCDFNQHCRLIQIVDPVHDRSLATLGST